MEDTSLLEGVEGESVAEDTEAEKVEGEGTETEEGVSIPEGLDPVFWDEENKALKQEDFIKAYEQEKKKALGLRQKLSKKGNYKPPKDVSEYSLNSEDENLKAILPDDGDALKVMKATALEANLTTGQFNDFLSKMIPQLVEKGVLKVDKQLSEEEQQEEFEEFRKKEFEKLGKDSHKIIASVKNWGNGMVNRGVLSKDELPVFQSFAHSAPAIAVLNKIMSLTGEPSIPVKTAVPDGLPSKNEINQMIGSKEYQDGNADVHKKVKAYFEAVHPTK